MSGRWLINLALLALVIGLIALIQRDLTTARTLPLLTELNASDLLLIEIVREGEPTITLGRTPTGWRMEAPLQLDADSNQINRLLMILNTPVQRSFPAQSADREQLGLASPKLRLRLNALEFAFGGIDPVEYRRYVANAELVHLIEDRIYSALIAPPVAYLSRQLLPRGFVPAFGRVNGVPLAVDTLTALATISAERLELAADTPRDATSSVVELSTADGAQLQFAVSEDRRRWRLNLPSNSVTPNAKPSLLYVLTTAPALTVDAEAIDPREDLTAPAASNAVIENALPSDPDALVPSDVEFPPPAMRLTPEGEQPLENAASTATRTLHGEPDKTAPGGFGDDPFAPEPVAVPETAPFR
ncbi:hypothetical protein CKO09_03580 [Chromatium weissei]|nr:hypothetical protein [Chromatium weissei]